MSSVKRFIPPLWLYLVIFLFFILAAFLYWQQLIKPVNGQDNSKVSFVIQKGLTIDEIASRLKEAGLIKSPLAFKLTVSKLGIARQIQAGSFNLSPAQNTEEIAKSLTQGTSDVWITLLEGWRREEIAQELEQTFSAEGVQFNTDTFLRLTADKEGYLFPDTYLVPLNSTPELILNLLTKTFDEKITPEMRQALTTQNLSLNQAIIMASLIEREAKSSPSRQLVSGILWKRLNNQWPLQVDATLQYALGQDEVTQEWWTPPTAVQKQIDSPYNTYQHIGLPPGPIANPSIDSLSAAIFPQESDYWYYLTGLDGNMYYATTLEEHNQNIEKYLR